MTMTEEYTPKTFKPSASVPIKTNAKLLCEVEWQTGKGTTMRFAVYETRGGAYIAVYEGDAPGKVHQVERVVTVVEPIYKGTRYSLTEGGFLKANSCSERDETAMQIAVIHAFSGHDRAKAMLKRELGWEPFIVVD